MVFFIFIAITILGMTLIVISEKDSSELKLAIGGILTVIGWSILLIGILVILIQHCNLDGQIASKNMEYNMLVYQYENDIYDNDNDLGKRELMEDIMNWNKCLAWRKEAQDDFWIGIYIPNIYDQFEFIELKGEQ